MSKQCAKCTKTVYPTEELKCLDKIWHKGCFKCESCGMTLNMKNYKGYNKMPYCNAHYPKTRHTAVADTPESRRIAENTKIQSNIKYHEEFEKSKGAKISIADDPETQRVRKNMETISNIAYHGELDKRTKMEMNRPFEQEVQNGSHARKVGSISDYDPVNEKYGSIAGQYPAQPQQQARQPSYQPPPQPQQQAYQPAPTQYRAPASNVKSKYVAMYDYTAADDDEVSFMENDVIVNTEIIDEGWMEGTVQRTGQRGMLPSNYVERCA